MTALWPVAALLALAVFVVVPPAPALGAVPEPAAREPSADRDWMRDRRWLWSLLAGLAGLTLLEGWLAPLAGVVAAVGCWVVIGRAEPAAVREQREAARRDLPQLVRLLASALSSGASTDDAIVAVATAAPGPAAERLVAATARLSLGADPLDVWSGLADDPALAPLGRTLVRAHRSGAPVVTSIERLADDLARQARAEVEDRARAVGVKAAVPLGICLLPAFLLVGIVPLVGGLVSELAL